MTIEHIFPLRVYYEDTDAGGVVYHASYLRFMERARSELSFTWPIKDRENNIFIVNHLELDFLRPARLYDQLEIVTRIIEYRGASILFEQSVTSKCEGYPKLIFCKGMVKVVNVNKNLKPVRLPKELIEKLKYDQ